MYFNKRKLLRISSVMENRVSTILQHYPERFDSESHVWRSALNSFYKHEILEKRKELE